MVAASSSSTSTSPSVSPTPPSAPPKYPPPGCITTFDPPVYLRSINITGEIPNDLWRVECEGEPDCQFTLTNSVLTTLDGKTRYITCDNYIAGTEDRSESCVKYDHGFSICVNGSLAIGESVVWYHCPNLTSFFQVLNSTSCDQRLLQVNTD